jgi:hypothetical protein
LLPTPRLGASIGASDLWVKDDGLNPTGSFKARGLACAVSMCKECRTHGRLFLSDRDLPNTPEIGVHLARLIPYLGLKPFHGDRHGRWRRELHSIVPFAAPAE